MELRARTYEVATITLSRPHRLDAWTGRMHTDHRWARAEAEADPATRVTVVAGAGRGLWAGAESAAREGHVAQGGYDPGIREPREPAFAEGLRAFLERRRPQWPGIETGA